MIGNNTKESSQTIRLVFGLTFALPHLSVDEESATRSTTMRLRVNGGMSERNALRLVKDAPAVQNAEYRRSRIDPFVGGGVHIRIAASSSLARRVFQRYRVFTPRALLLGRVPSEEFVPPFVVVDHRRQRLPDQAPRAFLRVARELSGRGRPRRRAVDRRPPQQIRIGVPSDREIFRRGRQPLGKLRHQVGRGRRPTSHAESHAIA